jgi:uncharacterized protein involved in type VI secretion and phage assembly
MTTIVDTIAAIVRHELAAVRTTELGVVEDVYPHASAGDDDNYGVDVTLKNSGLALKRVPVATGHVGTVAIPNIGDLVLVSFVHGDINAPIVVARLYDEVVFRLPLAESDEKSILAAIRNHPDSSPPRELIIEMPPKITVRVVDGSVTATAGQTEMRLDQSGSSGGTVTVKAGSTTITVNQDGDVTMDSARSVTVKASSNLTLEANGNIEIKAGGNLTAQAGSRAVVKGSLQASLEGGAGATVQGGTVSIKGMTSFSP